MGRHRSGSTIEFLAQLFAVCAHPEDILIAYLRRAPAGGSFRRDVEQLAAGRFVGRARERPLILTRAATMLRWLDGKDTGARNPFAILGLSPSASDKEILHRYRTLSKQVHPDRHSAARQTYWSARQKEINDAYRTLCDPQSRDRWQARLERRKVLLRRLWDIERSR